MRRTERHPSKGDANSLWHIYRTVSIVKVAKNFIVIQIARYTPFVSWKNVLYRLFLRMKVGKHTAFALMVVPDVMFPERISVGENSIIGFNTTILAHEYLIDEYRIGDVEIGNHVLIGANTTILPGIKIGDGAIVSAASLVNKDIPAGTFAGGNPVRIIYTAEEMAERAARERK
ncbi:acetyltransferase [Sporosarcina sp. P19]|uniref:acyltransferase n=1 Tax=Sporosarcina sp. P19 TaxID=2048258 RepID=UPI000C165410|nr:acyltransferase [Sporosarcina sp. P19]PIC77968.1 acetyltransferase [Sporosarcina sp. P19]